MAATALAIALSLVGLAWLTGTDPKRRRAFRLPPAAASHPRAGWAVALLPGLALPFFAGGGGFTIWIGAVSVAGWAIAALPPERTARLAGHWATLIGRITAGPARGTSSPSGDRIAALEARILALEAQLATIAPEPAAGQVEPRRASSSLRSA